MTKMPRLMIAALMTSTMLAGSAFAAGTHPVTGDALADDQTFTYRGLDDTVLSTRRWSRMCRVPRSCATFSKV